MLSDNIRFMPACSAVREAVRFALVALLMVLCLFWTCSAAPFLSGEWASTIAVEPLTETCSTKADFAVEITFGSWTAEARSVLEDDEWKKQDFEVKTALGDFSIESDLRFEPYKDRFRDWITKVEWEADVLSLTLTTKLARTTDWLIFEIEREWDMLEIGTSFRLRAPSGSRSLIFYDADVELAFDWCGIETDLEIAIDDDGFDKFVIELSDLELAQIPWVTFDLEFTRTAKKVTVELSPDVTLTSFWGSGSCELKIEGSTPNSPSILPIAITEAVLTWELEEWKLEAAAILDTDEWIAKAYWLELQAKVAFDLDDCSEVSLEVVFLWTETNLGRSRFALGYEIGDPFTITIEGDLDLDIGQLDCLSLELCTEW